MTDTSQRLTEASQNDTLPDSQEIDLAFFKHLLESTSTPLFVIDQQHRVIIWNQALVDLTGCPAESVMGTQSHWKAFYSAEQPTLADIALKGTTTQLADHYDLPNTSVLENGTIASNKWFINLNGICRYLHFEAAPVRGDNGDIIAVVETLHDITDRKRIEDSSKLFELAVEQSANSIVITDITGEICYVNNKFCEITGYSKPEIIGQNPRILKSGYHTDEFYTNLWDTISAGNPWQGELRNKRNDGTLFWEQASITPIKDDEGDLVMYLAVKEDITKRKEAEFLLQKQRAELHLKHEELKHVHVQVEAAKLEWEETLDCISDMVILANSSGTIIRCNRAVTDFTEKPFNTLKKLTWQQALEDAGLAAHTAQNRQELFHEPSNRWFKIDMYSSSIRRNSSTIVTLHDLTESKKINGELSAAYEQLKATHTQLLQQEKMASVGQLAAGVAHEINNPMGFIASNLGTMGKYTERIATYLTAVETALENIQDSKLRQELAETRKKLKIEHVLSDIPALLTESTDGAERVRNIVQNLKTFSRLDDNGVKAVDLRECITSTISIAWNEIKYKATLEEDYGQIPPVRCHAQQINQVLLNLLVNAAQAMDEQGIIGIKTWQEGDKACISVSDTGCGIPDHIRNRIFEPFFTTKDVGKGTGLGLSISYDIIKKHNGTIDVASTPGKGTTFTIRLPFGGAND